MEDGFPSATAGAVAQVRATMDRPVTEDGDGEIERRLVERFPSEGRKRMTELLERRTRWFDGVTLRCIEEGIGQVVLVGAGYDCRALRFRTPGVRFIELDHPATHADKQRIAAALAGAGHDASVATLFLVEGLLIYLPEGVIDSVLTALRARATPASRMAVSISRGQSPEFRARVAAVGENARSGFSEDEARAPCYSGAAGRATPRSRSYLPRPPARAHGGVRVLKSDPDP